MAPEWLSQVAARTQGWADFYGASGAVSLAVTYAHVAAMLIGGGLALAQDRAIWRLPSTDESLATALAGQQDAHRPVVTALAVSFVTGALMFAADVEALGGNWVYWVKMSMVALLLGNGVLMLRAERAAATQAPSTTLGALRRHAAISGLLWLLIALAGTGLLQG